MQNPGDRPTVMALTAKASEGDATALEQLLVSQLPALRQFIRRRSGPRIRATESESDITQSVCREVLTRVRESSFGSEAEFRAWLFHAARSKIIDRVRRIHAEKRGGTHRRNSLTEAVNRGEGAAHPTPSEGATAAEMEQLIENAMSQLAPGDRQLILDSKVIGLSHDSIARHLGIEKNTVKVRLHRALAKLSRGLPDLD